MRMNQNIAISETGFLFNPSTGESFTLNPVGLKLISYFKEGLSDDEIIKRMLEEYEADEREISRDLLDFKNVLKHYLLVDNND
jgi:hypothetical protein